MKTQITDSEWKIMEKLWEHGSLTQPELMGMLTEDWSKNTVHTFLTRLCKKELVQADKEIQPHRYRPLVTRETCVLQEQESFLDKVFGGSAGLLVSSFVKGGKLTKKERDSLRKLLEEMEDE